MMILRIAVLGGLGHELEGILKVVKHVGSLDSVTSINFAPVGDGLEGISAGRASQFRHVESFQREEKKK